MTELTPNKFDILTLKSERSGFDSQYITLTELPSGFRSYPDIHYVLVRGLFYVELLSVSKYVNKSDSVTDYLQLYQIYKDVIRLPNDKDISILELSDFIVLLIISSMNTTGDVLWNLKIRCSNINDGERCDGIIEDTLRLTDFEFSDPKLPVDHIDIKINNVDLTIKPFTLGDVIEVQQYQKSHKDVDPLILDYASLIKEMNGKKVDLQTRANFISFSSPTEVSKLKEISDDFKIRLNPIIKECPICHHRNRIKLGLTQLRGYP